jgi:hypothetical protein
MSTYEHDLLTARFAALAPRPLPGDWDDVLGRAGAVRPRRRRLARSLWRGGRRRKLVVALAVAVLVAAVAAAAYGTVRVLFLDRGFIGLPPEGATPSAPESGELVLRWLGRSATHATPHRRGFDAPFVGAWVYADGRMIWWRDGQVPEGANEQLSGYLEQRLTPAGVELLRSEVVGLVDRSRALLETVLADDDPRPGPFGGLALFVPLDYPSHHGSVEVRDGERLVRLQWQGIGAEKGSKRFHEILDDLRKRFEGTIATPEQLSALRRVDALLTDPALVLPSSAWGVREVRAYVPSHYAVCIDTSPPKDVSQLLALLPARAADVLRGKSRTRLGGEVVEAREAGRTVVLGRSVTYCSKLTTEEAREVADAVSGLARHPWALSLIYDVAEPVDNLNPTTISFDPYFPDGQFLLYGGGR